MPNPGLPAFGATQAIALIAARYVSIFRQRWRLVAAVLVVFLGTAIVYLATARPMYAATARLLIQQQGGRPLNVVNADPVRSIETAEDFIPTQMSILQSPRVVEGAIKSLGPRNLPTILAATPPGSPEPTASMSQRAIKGYLEVSRPDRNSLIVLIKYRASSPEEAVRMVNALVGSYQKFVKEHFQGNNSKLVSLISKARDELGRELEGLEKKYAEFLQSSPIAIDDESGQTLALSRMGELVREAGEARVKALRLKSQLDLGRKLAQEGAEMWAISYAMNQLSKEPNNGQIPIESDATRSLASDYLRQVIKEQQELAQQFGPGYSKVKELQEQIEQVQERTRASTGHKDQDGSRQLLASVQGSLEGIEAMRGEIEKQLQNDRTMMAGIAEGRNLRENLLRHKALFHTVVDQLKQAQFGGDFHGIDSEIVEQPNAPAAPTSPNRLLTLALALLAGSALGAGAAVVADGLDPRVRSVEELRDILGLNVLGRVPWLSAEEVRAQGEVSLISKALPRSPMAEAYRRVRTNIDLCRLDLHARVILVTSPMAGDGKSVTASNLAISLAQAGRRVLLVDADIRTPSLGRAFGRPHHPGLVHILRDLQPLGRVVQRTAIDKLDLVAAGPEVVDPSELLVSPRFRAFLDEVRPSYDVVIIDSPPLLLVTDTSIIGSAADGILLVVRAARTRREDAVDALEFLDLVHTPVLGVVVNGCGPERERYGYGYGYDAFGSDGSGLPTGAIAVRPAAGSVDGVPTFPTTMFNDGLPALAPLNP